MKRSRHSHRLPFLGVIVAALLLAALVLVLERFVPDLDEAARIKTAAPTRPDGLAPREREPEEKRTRPAGRRIAVIIDDIGHDLRLLEELLAIPEPVAFAVLPYAPHAAEAARIVHRAGREVLLHLPMEPLAYPDEDPGPGALFVTLGAAEIRSRIERSLAAVPYAEGVNNHMGSRFMEDEAALDIVMAELAKRGLYFVDSRTTAGSRGREAAARAGVRFAARSAFIDHTPGYAAALAALAHPSWPGPDRTRMLFIGHPHADTVRAIEEARQIWRTEGVKVIPLAAYLRPLRTGEERQESAQGRTALPER